MIQVNWNSNVNTKFFAFSDKPKDNVELTEYLSGRTVGYQRNTKKIMTFSCSLSLRVKDELPAFWNWFNDELGQTAGAFYCPALGSKLYRFVSVPSPSDTTRTKRTLTMEIEEVY